ncbi:MAG: hypothetical protein NUV51_07310 [Sulfuricaulis sp.]|nr:hypothetical protein [Sulfuricaulis sp.]
MLVNSYQTMGEAPPLEVVGQVTRSFMWRVPENENFLHARIV